MDEKMEKNVINEEGLTCGVKTIKYINSDNINYRVCT